MVIDPLIHHSSVLNDMWLFNVTSGWWACLNDYNPSSQVGLYETKGEASANNQPGARHRNSMAVHPSGQFILMFGGIGFDTVNSSKSLS